MFLSLDGLDGTGKSTQCRMLVDWLNANGHPAIGSIDPGGTALGAQIRAILLDNRQKMQLRTEALLFMASRAELVETIIRPALIDGKIVISDRFLLANVVYQGHAGGMDPEELWTIGRFSSAGLEPDHTFVLDLPASIAQTRLTRTLDRMEDRAMAFREQVRAGFLLEAARRPDKITIIDASPSIDAIHTQLTTAVKMYLRS